MRLPKMIVLLAALAALAAALVIGYLVLRPPVALLTAASFDRPRISPNADGEDDLAVIEYRLSRPAAVSIYLSAPNGDRYYFRQDERRSAGCYRVLFSGVVGGYTLPGETIAGVIESRLIPNDTYTWVIEAAGDGETEQKSGTLIVAEADSALPEITAFEISPAEFTPNQDGIRDRVSVNVYLAKPASLSVYLEDAAGQRYFLTEREEGRQPGDMGNHEYDYDGGVDQGMVPPPDGEYAVFAVAQDDEGQRIVREGRLAIRDGGRPLVEIVPQKVGAVVYFSWMPYAERYYTDLDTAGEKLAKPEGVISDLTTLTLAQGDLLVFKLTVHNYGATPVRTAGPFPGTVYQFDQTAASLEAYEESGAWRIGINCHTAYSDFPWRWALGPLDELQAVYDDERDETYYYLLPGQRAEVWGAIRMTEIRKARNPQECWAGLIHEDVGIPPFQSRVGAREIELVVPPAAPG
ncbi:MAG: hypothetical protein OZ934_06715 [Anaerolineae bacterium]|nr:hypothetical protein [Anaerolineae bacterium]